MVGKTAVWRAERKCFAWELSARAKNTLKTFAYETQVFLVCAENMAAAKVFSLRPEYCCAG
ncbi:hypothetical protein EGH73_08290 [Epilithonimonas hominis]|uniref:Uncharacterized protein n=1 Tax=Epilithonimonas hominis TaxID=420404 RepID=A0A3N0X8H1_9FLAO|nr:hypothetical protein EGH73_08290 [Epilithonimonas hominis]